MREIRFRGQTEGGIWVYGFYLQQRSLTTLELEHHICSTEERVISDQEGFSAPSYEFRISVVKPETVGQYIGNYNGVDLYENDIVKHKYRRIWQTEWHISKIEWNNKWGCYYLTQRFAEHRLREDVIYEVIGNTIDNPDLLKEI
jgi:hypothetical protein